MNYFQYRKELWLQPAMGNDVFWSDFLVHCGPAFDLNISSRTPVLSSSFFEASFPIKLYFMVFFCHFIFKIVVKYMYGHQNNLV